MANADNQTVGEPAPEEPADTDSGIGAFGDWLRQARLEERLTVAELADQSGVSVPAIYNLEAGRSRNPQLRTRERIARALGADVPAEIAREAQEQQEVAGIGPLTDFDPYEERDLPDCRGVYVFYDISDRPVYVGKAPRRSIRDRVRDHNDKFWFKRPVVNHAAYIQIDDENLCGQIEQVLIRFLKSNAVLNKQNVDR
jgi:transcriptional regulator with XRE-family HTH domain